MLRLFAGVRAFGILCLLVVMGLLPAPAQALPPPLYFAATHHYIQGGFADYWRTHGGLAQQGYPLSEEFAEQSALNGQTYRVQYFERAVFEYHPENAPGAQILLSQLGTFRYRENYPNGAPNQHPQTSGGQYFTQTGHWLGGSFRDYWSQHGGLAQQGYPISDEFQEISPLTGRAYTVQYFERAVFEYHPENAGTPYVVLLAQLGTFALQARYPPNSLAAAAPQPAPGSGTPTLAQLDTYINTLTPQQQIGELLMLPVYADAYTPALDGYLQRDQIANAVIFTHPNAGPVRPATLAGLRVLTQALIAHAPNPLIIATDEEGGLVDRLAPYYGATPAAAVLAATGDPQQAYRQAQIDAERLLRSGINVDFAPVVDVDQGGNIGAGRMFARTPAEVTQFAGAFLDGLQQHGVLGTLKHWPGLGATATNPDDALPTITKSRADLTGTDFAPFRALLTHNPGMIMVTHVLEPAYDAEYPASLSPTLVEGVLRGQLGYQGVVVSDAMAGAAISSYMARRGYHDPVQAVGEASVLAILAGEDLIECPDDAAQIAGTVQAVTQAVQAGRIPPARLRRSLERILALKVRMGLIVLGP
jgi:beta-N-acetylhexosaminidase